MRGALWPSDPGPQLGSAGLAEELEAQTAAQSFPGSLPDRGLLPEGELDRPALEALVRDQVTGDPMGAWGVVVERFGRQPKPSYVYVVEGLPAGRVTFDGMR